MANDPQENVDVTAGDELSEEVLSGVSGGDGPGSVVVFAKRAVVGQGSRTPIAACKRLASRPDHTP
jgi:hypothetical protein